MDCYYPKTIHTPQGEMEVRCGKCLRCLKHRQSEWTVRLGQELKSAPEGCYFITLTYSDETVPRETAKWFLEGEDQEGEFPELFIVSKKDLVKFNKDLRKRFQQGFFLDYTLVQAGMREKPERLSLPPCKYRFYLTSEYGPETHRPHYHGFYAGLPEDEDLVFDLVDQVWNKGFVTVEKAKSEACAAYVAKYLVSDSLVSHDPRVPKPFALMSQGLGKSYLETSFPSWHREAPLERCFTVRDGYRTTFPRYWRERIFDDAMKADIFEASFNRPDKGPSDDSLEALRQAEWRFRKQGKIK